MPLPDYVNPKQGIDRLQEAAHLLERAAKDFAEYNEVGALVTGFLPDIIGGISQTVYSLSHSIAYEIESQDASS